MSDALSSLDSDASVEQTQELASESSTGPREQFLRLFLVPDTTALLPIQQMTEVLTISVGQIVPVPHMPPWVMGVYNWRGDILWMIDLGHLCGLTPWYEKQTSSLAYKAIVLNIRNQLTLASAKSQTLGLVVDQVDDIEWCDPEVIQSLPLSTVTPELARFLRGYWWKPDDGMLAVLAGEAIIAAMPKL